MRSIGREWPAVSLGDLTGSFHETTADCAPPVTRRRVYNRRMSDHAMHVDRPEGRVPAPMGWGSDAVAELLRRLDLGYVALNPGASYRGLHDSLVNYLGNRDPQLLLALHEEHAVAIAHGYAKTSGQLGVAMVHDIVGLLHATNAIYGAYLDQAPVMVMGGTGPVAPRISIGTRSHQALKIAMVACMRPTFECTTTAIGRSATLA